MNKIQFGIIFLFFIGSLQAQSDSKTLPISVAYFSNGFIHPGAKIGTQIDLKNWTTEHQGRRADYTKSKSYFISPQLGFFAWRNNNISFLLNAELGYQRKISTRKSYSALSIGLGYLAESQVLSIVYNLSDGSIKNKNRTLNHYFLPTINYEFGRSINSKISWYLKPSLGFKLSTQKEATIMFLFEVGAKYLFKNQSI